MKIRQSVGKRLAQVGAGVFAVAVFSALVFLCFLDPPDEAERRSDIE